jgi:hypothetical protein
MAKKLTIPRILEIKLSKMEVNDNFSLKEFVDDHWDSGYDYFNRRSCEVALVHAKKKFPERKFKTIKGNVTRIS